MSKWILVCSKILESESPSERVHTLSCHLLSKSRNNPFGPIKIQHHDSISLHCTSRKGPLNIVISIASLSTASLSQLAIRNHGCAKTTHHNHSPASKNSGSKILLKSTLIKLRAPILTPWVRLGPASFTARHLLTFRSTSNNQSNQNAQVGSYEG